VYGREEAWESGKKTYNLALGAVVFFQHLDIWVLRKTVFAHGREVSRLPARAVEVMLDLWRHGDVVE
jgi:hypothetical protein